MHSKPLPERERNSKPQPCSKLPSWSAIQLPPPRTELISLSMSEVKAKLGNATPKKGEAYIVKNKRGQQIGSQITHDGLLLIDASVRPHGSATYYVSIGKPYQQKVYATGALYKIRKDDIAWENDR